MLLLQGNIPLRLRVEAPQVTDTQSIECPAFYEWARDSVIQYAQHQAPRVTTRSRTTGTAGHPEQIPPPQRLLSAAASTDQCSTPAIEQGTRLLQHRCFKQGALGRVDLLPSEQIEASPWRVVERHDLAFEREHPDARDGVVDAGARNAREQRQSYLVQRLLKSSMEQFGGDMGFFAGELPSHKEPSFRRKRLQKHSVQGDCLDTDERIDQCIHVAIALQYFIGLPHGRCEAVPEIVRDVLGARLIHAFLIFEVVLQRRRVDPGGGGDVARRGTSETMLAE
jgi:hypothetical protein